MYRYNTEPASPEWRRRLGSQEQVRSVLALDRLGGSVEPSREGAWVFWHGSRAVSRHRPVYKLYLSPATTHVRECLEVLLSLLPHGRIAACKAGADLHSLLRPDKMLAYFRGYDDLARTAADLRRLLAGMPSHGVPFTADLATGGLLSWGRDPAMGPRRPGKVTDSWRGIVCRSLGAGLVAAHRSGHRGPAARASALAHAARSRIDTTRWAPA